MLKNIFYTTFAIFFCLGLGKLLNHAIAGLPASLYGMLFYCLLLQFGLLNPSKVTLANQWIIKHMGICFVPASVGVINHFELIKHHGVTIVISIVFTTFILLTFIGLFAERYLATSNSNSVDGHR